jgi:multicomponent Na+:H+ antiporter subunit D
VSTAGTAALLPVSVVLPIAGAVLAPLLARLNGRLPLLVGVGTMLGSTAVLVVVATRVYRAPGELLSHFLGHVGPVNGAALGIAFEADPFGLTFALLTASLGTLLLISTVSELGELGPRELGGFACLFQLLLAALTGAALTADTINMFVWFEVAALASYGLTGFFLERPIALEAAFKLLVLTSIAGFAIFIASAMLYDRHGALNLAALHQALRGHVGLPDLVALALLVCGFATKAGLLPFHTWLPDAHTAAPGSVSALFSALMVNLGVVGLVRITLLAYPPGQRVLGVLTVLGVGSALLGALLALAQDDLKRLLAWDTVSQMGVLTVGFATRTVEGTAGATYHLLSHALFKAVMFLCAGAVVHATGETSLAEMGGLVRHRPLLTGAFTVGVLAIAGVPPLTGYASLGLIHTGVEQQPVVYGALVLAQVVTVAALGRAAYLGFYRRRSEPYEHLEPPRAGARATLLVLGTSCVAFGLVPSAVIDHVAAPAAALLRNPDSYQRGVLNGFARLKTLPVHFAYLDPTHLVVVGVTVLSGLLLARWTLRRDEPLVIRALRGVHTGSVNDYAMYASAGIAAVVASLLR